MDKWIARRISEVSHVLETRLVLQHVATLGFGDAPEAGMTLNSLKEKFKAGILLRELLVMTVYFLFTLW